MSPANLSIVLKNKLSGRPGKTGRIIIRSLFSIFFALVFFCLADLIFPVRTDVAYSQMILSPKGEILHAYLTPDYKWRLKTELSEISPVLKKVIIYKEDKYFRYHWGINPVAVVRALIKNTIRGKITSGASTISMQVARMLYRGKRNYGNKLLEMFRAMQLEWHYSKNEILALYLNLVPYGSNIEGVKSASLLYFDEKPEALSLAQVTALSIIPNNPSACIPGRNNSFIMEKRNFWLTYFLRKKLFNNEIIEDAINEPFNAYRHEAPKWIPHLAHYLHGKYPEKNSITCFIDLNKQFKAENLVFKHIEKLKSLGITNAAVIIINNKNNRVEAYIGSADYYDAENSGQVDGTRAYRSPGSTLKPLLFALAADKGIITPKQVLLDVPENYNGYRPENYDEKCRGTVTAENALAMSLNIPFVKLLNEMGVSLFIGKLEKAGFEKVSHQKKDLGLSMILGGCGVNLMELSNLFHCYASKGVFHRASLCMLDPVPPPDTLISPAAAFLISEILSQINRPDFPAHIETSMHLPRIAWKTGTSYGRKDAWSIGYNRHYTVGVWVGNFNGKGVPELNGSDIATPLLFKIFNSIDYNSEKEWFNQPDDIDKRLVCSVSGLIPSDFCTDLVEDYYLPGIFSGIKCSHLKEVFVEPEGKYSYCRSCLPEIGYKKMLHPNLDPALIDYYEENGIPFTRIPPHNSHCTRVFRDNAPKIMSPSANAEYILMEGESQRIMLKATVEGDVMKLYWYINNVFYTSSSPGEILFFTPKQSGIYKISCADDKGRNTDCSIKVKML